MNSPHTLNNLDTSHTLNNLDTSHASAAVPATFSKMHQTGMSVHELGSHSEACFLQTQSQVSS